MEDDGNNLVEISLLEYVSLQDKLEALLNGHTLLLRSFEQETGSDLLCRISSLGVCEVSKQLHLSEGQPDSDRYWAIYNIGINDLVYTKVYDYNQENYEETNLFSVGDTVSYISTSADADNVIKDDSNNVYYSPSMSSVNARMIGKNVYVSSQEGVTDVAHVTHVFKGDDGKYYYNLSREDTVYEESQLTLVS